jgi:hypothetical protein
VALSDTGSELWTVSEAPHAAGLTLTGYVRTAGGHWDLRFSFAAFSHLPAAAVAAPVALHLLPAARAVAAVCPNGTVLVASVCAPALHPVRFQLVRAAQLCKAWSGWQTGFFFVRFQAACAGRSGRRGGVT